MVSGKERRGPGNPNSPGLIRVIPFTSQPTKPLLNLLQTLISLHRLHPLSRISLQPSTMVKKSKKSKSKRVSLKKKYKIIRKVKEHHKKKAKEAKKLGLHKHKKVEKDPGIPNDWPFKEEELKALEVRRARAVEELEQKKAARKERAKKRKLGLTENDDTSMEDQALGSNEADDHVVRLKHGDVKDHSERAFYKELVKVIEASDVILEVLDARDPLGTRCVDMESMVLRSGPEKKLVLLLNKIDLVPREAVEKWLKYLREELPTVAFKCSTQQQRMNLAWKSSKAVKPNNLLQTSDCLGAETLLKLLKNYSRSHEPQSHYSRSATWIWIVIESCAQAAGDGGRRLVRVFGGNGEGEIWGKSRLQGREGRGKGGAWAAVRRYGRLLRQAVTASSVKIKKSITVGIIGLPNVGKSSLINSLKRSHVVNVGATPGLTRSMQEVHLDKNVKLLDCPGVVMLKSVETDASIALRNCKRIENLEDPVGPGMCAHLSFSFYGFVDACWTELLMEFAYKFSIDAVKEILKLCPANVLVTLYKVPGFDSVDEFLRDVATVRGRLKKGGIVDVDAAARIVLHDWNEGKIPYYTMPPSREQVEVSEARFVPELGKEFNVDEVYGSETSFIGSLKSVDDFQPVEVPPNPPLNFDERMIEGDVQPSAQDEVEDAVDEDQSMATEETAVEEEKGKTNRKSATARQNEKLYEAEGILNTKVKRAEKKRRKKATKLASSAMESDDYDFKVDFRLGPAMIVDDEDAIKSEVPMGSIKFDDE
ncbi:Guanine nucleotide-binding protein-like NSN1-like protein [Drosera capensis]